MTDLGKGDTVYMRSSSSPLLVGERLGRGGQGVVFGTEINGRQLAIKWYPPSPSPPFDTLMRDSISRLVEIGRPKSPAFIWPIEMVSSPARSGFGYIMPRLEQRFITCMQMISRPESPSFDIKIRIGLNLVDAFASLHTTGQCYRDVSFGNVYVDPATGDVAIIDNDNVGVTGGQALIKGTLDFMAPEVMLDKVAPCTESDLYSLALFLFYMFCHGHPLDGQAVESSYNSNDRQPITQEELIRKHYGESPVFVFDPVDSSNRPVPGAPVYHWWREYPAFFQNLFIRSFTVGLHDPTLTGRLVEGMWTRSLHRLADCVWECDHDRCLASLLFDPANPERACWRCGRVPAAPLLLTAPGHQLVLWRGAVLMGRHLMLPGRPDEVLGEAGTDPGFPGSVLLRNMTDESWEVQAAGEEPKKVKPGQRLLLRPMKIKIAGKRAVIVRAGAGHDGAGHDGAGQEGAGQEGEPK